MTVRQAFGRPLAYVPTLRVPRFSDGGWLALAAFVVYLLTGAWLALVARDIEPDSWSRTANAYYVLFSRDPHLGAIGFVWAPLHSMVILPLLVFSPVWPELATHAFAAIIVSAAFMAGCVYLLWRIASDLRVHRIAALAIPLLFAVNPEIIFHGANGLSEGLFLFLLLGATWALMRWLDGREVLHLTVLGSALGLAYLTRYEAVAAGAAALGIVGLVSLVRARGRIPDRLLVASADALIVAVPFVVAVAVFAIASWVAVGHPFATFDSAYGNTAQVDAGREALLERTGLGTPAAVPFVRNQVLGLMPAVPLLLIVAGIAAARRRDPRILAPLAVLGGVLLFAIVAFLTERTVGILRFYISVIPLAAVLASFVLAETAHLLDHHSLRARWRTGTAFFQRPGRPRRLPSSAPQDGRGAGIAGGGGAMPRGLLLLLSAVALGSLLVGAPSTLATRLDPRLGDGRTEFGQRHLLRAEISEEAAGWLDRQQLPAGSVLLDAATSFRVVMRSENPRQFVITPDRDFAQVLANPVLYGVRYMLVTSPVFEQPGGDALAAAYPSIYEDGAGLGRLAYEASRPDEVLTYRIYEVVSD
jgi:hypothetical protein